MAIRSNWAYNNGKKILREAVENLTDPKTGWIQRGDIHMYAERNNDTGKLIVKTYANKKQAELIVQKQKESGINAFRSIKYPYTVCVIK